VARLVAQTLGVVIASGLVYALVQRAGVRLPFPRAAAVAAVALLGVLAAAGLRDSWEGLDEQRKQNAGVTAEAGRTSCLAVGVDRGFLDWVAARIPPRAKFHMSISDEREGNAGTCIGFLLLPRIRVADPDDARYVVFWEHLPAALLAEVGRRGGIVETYSGDLRLARIP
jgi:hypothetical protein